MSRARLPADADHDATSYCTSLSAVQRNREAEIGDDHGRVATICRQHLD